jgi:hypothetical protein
MFVAFFATGESWEGATNGMSQKTYLGAFKRLYLQDTGKVKTVYYIPVFVRLEASLLLYMCLP